MRLRLGHELKLRPEPPEDDDERIISFRLSDEDFELAKQVNEEDRDKFLEWLEEKRVKLPELQEDLVGQANSAVENIIDRYSLDLPRKFYETIEIYPLHAADYKQVGLGEGEEPAKWIPDTAGMFIPENKTALLWYPKKSYLSEDIRNVRFLHTAAHEIVHAKAYQAMQAFREEDKEKPEVGGYRSGLLIYKLGSGKQGLFNELSEAITEMLGIEVLEEVVSGNKEKFKALISSQIKKRLRSPRTNNSLRHEAYERGVLEIDRYGDSWKGENEFVQEIYGRGFRYKHPPMFQSYHKERKVLHQVIETITRKNPDYEDKEDEVKALFYKAYFTGRMLELGRVIEHTFGKGTFRLIAEKPFGPELQERLK